VGEVIRIAAMTDVEIIRLDELPPSTIAREFVGADHGGVGICAIFVEAPPGAGPSLHRHPYPEIVITQEGTATFLVGEEGEPRAVGAGEMVVIPAGQWHAFVNSGDGPLRQVDIHVSASFDTEWLV
jgi:quercetin dioxygenase-like cupin family protein